MNKQVTEYRKSLIDAINARIDSETAANTINDNKLKNLRKYAANADHDAIASVLLACNYDVNAVKANVYEVEKAINTARFIASVDSIDIYTRAILASALECEKQSIAFTREVAQSACSVDYKHSDSKVERAIKATRVALHKAKSTVMSQHSSSLNAMLKLSILSVSKNASNDDVFTVNRESYATKKLAERFEIAL